MRCGFLEREAEAEMEGAEIFICARTWVHPIIEPHRANRQIVTQPHTDGVSHVVQAWRTRVGQQISGIDEDRA